VIQVPGYLIKREIGVGGMATVFLAVQTSLEREIALKVMTPALVSDPNFSRRFLMEARTLASLSHPNIVAVYDVGVTEQGLHYFSMQHLPGGDFAQRIRSSPSQQEIVRVLGGVARALGFAHLRGFVHRDVSPANILFDVSDNPILTDFGIARAVSSNSRLTNAGVSVGTSHYMSPEQARGGNVDARSDLYSLGAVAYEALTGKPPFDGEDGFAIAYAHVFEPVPRLPEHLAHWQPLVDRALAKDPAERYADAEQFVDALSEVVARGGLSASRSPVDVVADATPQATLQQGAAPEPRPAPVPVPATAEVAHVRPAASRAVPRGSPAGGRPWRLIAGLFVVVVGLGVLAAALLAGRDEAPARAAAPAATATPAATPLVRPAPTPAATIATPEAVVDPAADPGLDAAMLGGDAPGELIPSTDPGDAVYETDPVALQRGQATGVQDPVQLLLAIGRADVAGRRLANPPGRNALERYRLALRLAEHFNARAEQTRAREGIAETAEAYVTLADESFDAGKLDEFVEYLGRAVEIGASVPEGQDVATRARERLARERDAAIAAGETATRAWDQAAAVVAYDRALRFDPRSEAATRGLATARRIGEEGYVFRDAWQGGRGPEMLVKGSGATRLAWARSETTLAEFRAFWADEGARVRGGDRPKCRDRESFFGSTRGNTFEAPDYPTGPDHPVVCVSAPDAKAYAAWLSRRTGKRYRLPTAAEWLAVTPAAAPGDCKANIADASFREAYGGRDAAACDDGHARTAPARSFAPASGGLYDLAGNVREWVGDCAGNCREHNALGSAWLSPPARQDPRQRDNWANDTASNTIGFRVVREVD
jgi:tetratricopeptide (TPR) repeat protein